MPEPKPVDPDVDLHDPGQRAETGPGEWRVLAAIAVGGIVGAEARYGLGLAWPHASGAWPWSTLATNVIGSALVGVVMAALSALRRPPRLARPFLGVGVLGGFTTFSTFAIDAFHLLQAHRPSVGLAYMAASVAVCVAGCAVGGAAVSAATKTRAHRRPA